MKITGTAHLIHKLDNLWIFKYIEKGITLRIPLYHNDYKDLYDGQEIICKLEEIKGVEIAIPIL